MTTTMMTILVSYWINDILFNEILNYIENNKDISVSTQINSMALEFKTSEDALVFKLKFGL